MTFDLAQCHLAVARSAANLGGHIDNLEGLPANRRRSREEMDTLRLHYAHLRDVERLLEILCRRPDEVAAIVRGAS